MLQIVSKSETTKTTGFAHSAATTSHTPLVINGKVLIPLNTANANDRNAFVYSAEILGATTDTGAAWAVNDPIYWDATNSRFTKTSTSNTLCGHALEPKLSGDAVSGLIAFDSYTVA
jgi:hypothetical protein